MKNLLFVFCLTSLLLCVARAEDAVPVIKLKQQSKFDAMDARDPFWPIGWKKPGPKSSGGEAGPNLSPASFALTSVTMGADPHFVILNGKVMQQGQQFGVQFGNHVYEVTLSSIEDGHVVLAYQGGEITVPLRRK